MASGPWSASADGKGLPVVFNSLVPERTYWKLNGHIYVHDKASLSWLVAGLNRFCKRIGYGPTKAMLGNSRRRALMAQIEARTTTTADFAVAT